MTAPDLPSTPIVEESQTVWSSGLQPAGCRVCGQAYLVNANRLGQRCPSCATGALEPQPARLRPEPPELTIPFEVEQAALKAALEAFVRPVWLKPDDFTTETLWSRLIPVYWPMWLVDADVSGDWQAEVGYDYQVKSSQESYTGSGWQTRERVETRARWEPRLGQIARHYDNIAAPALENHTRLQALLGEYRRQAAVPFNPDQTQHAALRIPDLPPENAWPFARAEIERTASNDCQQAAGGQHIRNYKINAEYRSLHYTQLLQPVYMTYYTNDEGAPQPVYINGQTGKVGGLRLASQKKGWRWAGILAGSGALLLILGLLLVAAGALVPPVAALGAFLVVVACLVGVSALIPAIWPWQWNRQQQPPKVISR